MTATTATGEVWRWLGSALRSRGVSLAVRAKPVPALERPKGRQCCSSEDAGIVRRAVQGCLQFGGGETLGCRCENAAPQMAR